MKKILTLALIAFLFTSCKKQVIEKTAVIMSKEYTSTPDICEFEYIGAGGYYETFLDSCDKYKVGDKIKK